MKAQTQHHCISQYALHVHCGREWQLVFIAISSDIFTSRDAVVISSRLRFSLKILKSTNCTWQPPVPFLARTTWTTDKEEKLIHIYHLSLSPKNYKNYNKITVSLYTKGISAERMRFNFLWHTVLYYLIFQGWRSVQLLLAGEVIPWIKIRNIQHF